MTTETIFIFKIKFIQILFHLFLLMEYVKQHKHVPKCPRDNSYVLLSMFWSSDHKLQRILGRQKRYISCSRHRKTKFTNSESPIFTTIFFNNIGLMYTLCFLVASVKLKVYKKVVKFSYKQQKILGIRNS